MADSERELRWNLNQAQTGMVEQFKTIQKLQAENEQLRKEMETLIITSPILGERKKTVDPAENRGETPILGGDMRQAGKDMVLLSIFATSYCQEGCGDLFQI